MISKILLREEKTVFKYGKSFASLKVQMNYTKKNIIYWLGFSVPFQVKLLMYKMFYVLYLKYAKWIAWLFVSKVKYIKKFCAQIFLS